MSLLAEIKNIAKGLSVSVETGVFSDKAPDEYIVFAPLSDGLDMHCDNMPTFDRQEVRVFIFSKGNYSALKYKLVTTLFQSDISITDRLYIGYESDTGYHHYAIDTLKTYEGQQRKLPKDTAVLKISVTV